MGTTGEATTPVVERVCEWEACQEKATCDAKWRRENPPYGVAYDHASYCDGHFMSATAHGAVATQRR